MHTFSRRSSSYAAYSVIRKGQKLEYNKKIQDIFVALADNASFLVDWTESKFYSQQDFIIFYDELYKKT